MIISYETQFTVLDRDALDRVDQPCYYCGRRITGRKAPAAKTLSVAVGRPLVYAHECCPHNTQGEAA